MLTIFEIAVLYVLRGCSCNTDYGHMIILCCDQLWAGGEDVKENEGRRPK